MDIDIRQLAREFDDEFGSNAQRHEKKLAAIPEALNADEAVTLITDVQLVGAFRADVLVATETRLLIVRKDGKRIDEYDLSELLSLTLKEPDGVGSLLTVVTTSDELQGRIHSEPAAVALLQVINYASIALRALHDLPPPTITMPSTRTVDPTIAKIIRASDRDYGTFIARHRSKIAAIPSALLLKESVVSIIDLTLEGAVRTDIAVCTDKRLLIIRREGDQVDSIHLNSIRSVTLGKDTVGEPKRLTIKYDTNKTWQAAIDSPKAAKRFARTVRLAIKKQGVTSTNSSQDKTDQVDAHALTRQNTPTDSDLPPSASTAHYSLEEIDNLLRQPLHSIPHEVRERLYAHFADMFGFPLQKYKKPLAALLSLVADDERLILLLEINRHRTSSPKLIALTSKNIIVQGPRAGGLDIIALHTIESVSTTATGAAGTVRIILLDGKVRTLRFVPESCIGTLVEAAEAARIEEADRVRQEMTQRFNRLEDSLTDSMRNEIMRNYSQIADRNGIILNEFNLRQFALVDHLIQEKGPGFGEKSQLWREEFLLISCPDLLELAASTSEELDEATTDELLNVGQNSLARLLAFLALRLDEVESGDTDMLRIVLTESLGIDEGEMSQGMWLAKPNDLSPFVESSLDLSYSGQYLPTAVHSLSEDQLTRVYDQIARETVDFEALTKWQLSHLPEVMLPGELLIWLAEGYLQGSFKDPGDSGGTMIAVTDRRLLLLVDPWLATNQVKAFRLTDITAVHRDGGFITGGFRFRESGGGQRKITKMNQSAADSIVAKLQAAIDAVHSPQPQRPLVQESRPPASDVADQLEKLANLVDRGFLTPEEFAEQKAKLLNG